MIITDVVQIDRMAETVLAMPGSLVSVDIYDYALIKEHSSSLKAVKANLAAIDESSLSELDEAIKSACDGKKCNFLLYICQDAMKVANPITFNHLQLLQNLFAAHLTDESDFIWGMCENGSEHSAITIYVFVGYCK